jgi:hypothetical protein
MTSTRRVPSGRITQTSSEMTFHGGGLIPILILGLAFGTIGVGCFLTYYFYSSSILQTISLPSVSSSTLWIISISVSAFFFFIGIMLVVFDSETSMVISRSRGEILLLKKRAFGHPRMEKVCGIGDALRVELRKEYKMEKITKYGRAHIMTILMVQPFIEPKQVTYWKSVLVLKDGIDLELGCVKTYLDEILGLTVSNARTKLVQQHAIASEVASFLGVPVEDMGWPSATPNIDTPEG